MDKQVEWHLKRLRGWWRSAQTRRDAATALGELEAKEALEPLIDALRGRDITVRAAAAYGLERLRESRASAPLLIALKDNYDPTVRFIV